MNLAKLGRWMQQRGWEVFLYVVPDTPIAAFAVELDLTVRPIQRHRRYFDVGKALQLRKLLDADGVETVLIHDGRDMSLEGVPPEAQLILVADMFYEKSPSARFIPLLAAARKRGVRVVLADGGRSFAPKDGVQVLAEQTVDVHDELEGRPQRHVRLLEFTGCTAIHPLPHPQKREPR